MNDQDQNLKELIEKPNKLIYNVQTAVYDNSLEENSLEIVRFVLDTKRDEEGFLNSLVLNENYCLLTTKKYKFSTIEEFFALIAYIVRNGIVKNC